MSTVNQQEVLASFKVLVSMAKADGKLKDEEFASLVDTFAEIHLPEGVTVENLLASDDESIEVLLSQITSEIAQEMVYQSAYAMANVDGECSPEEEALLTKISQSFTSSKLWGKQEWIDTLEKRAQKSSISEQLRQVDDPEKRAIEVDNVTTDTCFLNAVLGAFPLPGIAIAFDMLIYWNQLDLVQAIGKSWGYDRGREDLRKAIFGSLGITGTRIAVSNLAKLVPIFGMVVGATTAYASTWALGKVANEYFASGGEMDSFSLRQAFKKAKQEGEAIYKAKSEEIIAKKQAIEPQLHMLNQELQDGSITPEEYQEKLKEFLKG
ncbi:MAG: TerB family tellurite resistance protein [Pseudanabaenaceae cyanobacterium bins.39]|nr:TerB family tellurite resistance protein [Pseudanabaenaceae cyanobacterium bins.39]